MNRHTITPLPTLMRAGLLVLALFLTGCSEDTTSPLDNAAVGSDSYTTLDFSQEFGGLTFSDEPEAFADEALKQMLAEEDGELVADPLAEDAEVLALESMGDDPADPADPTRPRFTFLRLRWGMVHGPDDSLTRGGDCGSLDWTGEIHTDRGIVLVRRVLAFERPADRVIFPRLNRQTVAFVSHTGCHYDGLLLQVIERPQDYSEDNPEPNRLHINTGPFAGSYEVSELAELDEMVDVDTLGNRIQLTGFTLSDINYCPKGFLSGRFRVLPNDGEEETLGEDDPAQGEQLGTYAGLWVDLTGRIHGFLRGGYGLSAEGQRVFVGKYIDRQGRIRGMLRGTWEPAEDEVRMAAFQGEWVSSSGQIEGLLGGRAHGVPDYPGGFFEGRWTAVCDDEAEGMIL